jgi:hypothetical protein
MISLDLILSTRSRNDVANGGQDIWTFSQDFGLIIPKCSPQPPLDTTRNSQRVLSGAVIIFRGLY